MTSETYGRTKLLIEIIENMTIIKPSLESLYGLLVEKELIDTRVSVLLLGI